MAHGLCRVGGSAHPLLGEVTGTGSVGVWTSRSATPLGAPPMEAGLLCLQGQEQGGF